MTILIGARIEEATVKKMDDLILKSPKYRDRTHMIKVALHKLLIEEGVIPNEQNTTKTIP